LCSRHPVTFQSFASRLFFVACSTFVNTHGNKGNKGLTVKTEDGQFLVVRSLGDKGIEIATEDNEVREGEPSMRTAN